MRLLQKEDGRALFYVMLIFVENKGGKSPNKIKICMFH